MTIKTWDEIVAMASEKPPTPLENPDLTGLAKICQEYVDFLQADDYHEDNDYNELIAEAALTAILGEAGQAWCAVAMSDRGTGVRIWPSVISSWRPLGGEDG